jgi:ACR3 family arsenite efflux pump ArsB
LPWISFGIISKISVKGCWPYEIINASNHLEVAFDYSTMLFGLNSSVALATVAIVLEVPVMIMLVKIYLNT